MRHGVGIGVGEKGERRGGQHLGGVAPFGWCIEGVENTGVSSGWR